MTQFLQQLVNGLSLGSIYALIALGYTMVYGIIKLINFAHGDIYMLGAFVAFYATRYFQLNFFLALIVAMLFCGVLGVVIERIAYKPLRHATRITALITAVISDVTIIGASPNCIEVGFHTVPKMNLNTPIYDSAGTPLIKMKIIIRATARIDTLAHKKKPPSNMRSPVVRASTGLLLFRFNIFFMPPL